MSNVIMFNMWGYLKLSLSGVLAAESEHSSQLAGVDTALSRPVVLDEGVLEPPDLLRAQIRVLHEEYLFWLWATPHTSHLKLLFWGTSHLTKQKYPYDSIGLYVAFYTPRT